MTPDLEESATWLNVLREELEVLDPQDRFITSGEWIAFITFKLLPELAARRRGAVLDMLDASDGATAASVAAQLGMRKTTIDRLLEEGRHARKGQENMSRDWDDLLPSPHPSL